MNTQQTRKIHPVKYKFEPTVKHTDSQIKKHMSQFSETESILLSICVDNIKNNYITVSDHAKTHIPFLNHHFVRDFVSACDIIEFNVTKRRDEEQCRVLVRSHKTFPIRNERGVDDGNVCLVIDLKSCTVVSSYVNYSTDTHRNLDMNRYDESLNVVEFALKIK